MNITTRCLGGHLIADLVGLEPWYLTSYADLRQLLIDIVDITGSTIVGETSHEFPGGGWTIGILLAESHTTLHSWPEEGILSLDAYTCTGYSKLDDVAEYLRTEFGGQQDIHVFPRLAVIPEVFVVPEEE